MADTIKIGRQTIIFFLPNSMEAFANDQSPNTLSDEGVGWYKAQMYINPQSFNINESKLIKSEQTKGGFVTQYWGEDLTKIDAAGTTGSSGIEGINVLRGIYRHEQAQYRVILNERKRELAEAAASAAVKAAGQINSYSDSGFENAANLLTGGAFSQTVEGLNNSIDLIKDAYSGNVNSSSRSFKSTPTLAALATNIDMYYQGEFFRGYFSSFRVTESASEPGNFNYNFNFVVLRRTGERKNFMPWHRNPLDSSGNTQMSKAASAAKGDPDTGGDNFTFPIAGYTVPLISQGNIPEAIENQEGDLTLSDGEVSFPQNRPGQG